MNPILTSKDLIDTYFRYLLTRFPLGKTDPEVREKFKNILYSSEGKQNLIKGPILEIMPPYKKSRSLKDLCQENSVWSPLVNHFDKNKNFDISCKLYLHQEKALIKSINNNIVVAAGTGSGKTECFLFPIIKYCLEHPGIGVRAILVYPLNALVEDQIQRLGKYLKGSQITFGKYTGQTPRDPDEDNKICSNHLTSRKEMRLSPPNVLITNYAMLEYMLLRPGDSSIIDSGDRFSYKFLVLDEAHTYSGAQGTEVAYLIKRLRSRVKKGPTEIRYIATSATLGSGQDVKSKAVEFAHRLFGAPFSDESIINSEKQILSKHLPEKPSDHYQFKDFLDWELPTISLSYEEIENKFSIKSNKDNIQNALYDNLKNNKYVKELMLLLEDGPKLLDQLAKYLFPHEDQYKSNQALVNLVAWADFAKDNSGLSLLPARYHMFISATKGLFCELAPTGSKRLWKDIALSQNDILRKEGNPYPFELGVCKICGETYIMGVFVQDNKGKRYKPIADSFFEDLDTEDSESEKVILQNKPSFNSTPVLICSRCGVVDQECDHHDIDKVNLYIIATDQNLYNDLVEEITDEEHEEIEKTNNKEKGKGCVNCGSGKSVSKIILPLRLPANGSTPALVSTLFSHCPDMEKDFLDQENEKLVDKYGRRNTDWTPIISKGKKLLIFSDSRQEAAFFGPYMQVSHIKLIISRFMVDILRSKSLPISIEEWKDIANNRLRNYANSREFAAILLKELRPLENFTNELVINNTSRLHRIYHSILQLIDRTASYISGLEGLGLGAVYFDDPNFANLIKIPGLSRDNIFALAQLILRYIRLLEVFKLNPEEDLNLSGYDGSDAYFGYRYYKVILIDEKEKSKGENLVRLISKTNKPNRLQEQIRYSIARMKYVDVDHVTLDEVNEVIIKISHEFIGKELKPDSRGNGYQLDINTLKCMVANPKTGEFHEKIPGGLPRFKACKKCGRLSWININNMCNYQNCYGELTDPDFTFQMSKDNHYRNILLGEHHFPELRAVEHTAQLNKMTAAKEYQMEFKRGRINILSCSTTFELGVDLGDLSSVFMRNIPPAVANYVQRAGRAGRRIGISPFVLTFCRSLPHDQYFFRNYKMLVRGEVNPPAIVLENEKIIRRHFNAVILSDFLKEFKTAFTSEKSGYSTDPLMYQLFDKTYEFNSLILSQPNKIRATDYLCKYWIPKKLERYNKHLEEIFLDSSLNPLFFKNCLHNYFDYFVSDTKYGLQMNIEDRYINAVTYYETERDKCDPKIPNQRKDFDYFQTLLKQTKEEQLIAHLSSHGFLPSYAFPTNVVPLKILSDRTGSKLLDLNRELDMAISEYAPDAMVVANSRIYTSGALHKYPKQVFKRYFYYHCKICQRFFIDEDKNKMMQKAKNHQLTHNSFDILECNPKNAIFPEWGFSVPRDFNSERIISNSKLERSGYSSQLYMDVEGFKGENPIKIERANGGLIEIDLANGFNMYRINPGKSFQNSNEKKGFTICARCGRSLNEKPKNHKTPFGHPCEGTEILPNNDLLSIFDTDIVKIRILNGPPIPKHVVEERNSSFRFKSFWRSVLYSFLESISRVLEIERNDIDGLYIPYTGSKFSELVFIDSVSGGAGHVARLVGKGGEDPQMVFNKIIETAQKILNCKECAENTACYSCLFHHSNQNVQHTLNRGLALKWMEQL